MFDPQRWRWPLAGLLGTLTLSSFWWLGPFMAWLEGHANQVQGLDALIQVTLVLMTALAVIGRSRADDPAALARAAAEDQRGLGILRERVRQEVDERLRHSLFRQVQIALGRTEDPHAVATTWGRELECPGAAPRPLPPERPTVAVFDDSAGALLILGEPGAGKTVELLDLARALLVRDETDPDPQRPVPVFLNLSSWAEGSLPLADWIAHELFRRHQIPRRIGVDWVARERLLLLLDGLDEVTEPRRGACAAAINAFREVHGLTRLAVCCRAAEYRALGADLPTLRLGTAIRLLPLERGQIERYLIQAGPALTGLRRALAEDADLAALAATPLMLNVMSLTWQSRPREMITAAALGNTADPAARGKALFDAYLERVFSRKAGGAPAAAPGRRRPLPDSPFTESQTRRWLVRLAAEIQRRGRTLFQVEDVQPDWGSLWVQFPVWVVIAVSVFVFLGLDGGGLMGLLNWLLFGTAPGLVDGLIRSGQLGALVGGHLVVGAVIADRTEGASVLVLGRVSPRGTGLCTGHGRTRYFVRRSHMVALLGH